MRSTENQRIVSPLKALEGDGCFSDTHRDFSIFLDTHNLNINIKTGKDRCGHKRIDNTVVITRDNEKIQELERKKRTEKTPA